MRNPLNNEEKLHQQREAIGVIRASRFIRKYARSRKPITFETISQIHKEIFKDAWPEIAGKYRQENLEIANSKHLPPHYSVVPQMTKIADDELRQRLSTLKTLEAVFIKKKEITEEITNMISGIIAVAAWLHHKIAYIHPFREGNGRTARLATNLILERYGLVGISIRIERENKNKYCQALAQIDQQGDYEPLKDLIENGLLERYEGIAVKYYKVK